MMVRDRIVWQVCKSGACHISPTEGACLHSFRHFVGWTDAVRARRRAALPLTLADQTGSPVAVTRRRIRTLPPTVSISNHATSPSNSGT